MVGGGYVGHRDCRPHLPMGEVPEDSPPGLVLSCLLHLSLGFKVFQGISRSLIIKFPWPNFMHILYVKLNCLYFLNVGIIMGLGCGKGCPFSLFCAGIIHLSIKSLSQVKANSSGQCYVLH